LLGEAYSQVAISESFAASPGDQTTPEKSTNVVEEIDSTYLAPAGITAAQINAEHKRIKQRYIQYLIGTKTTFKGRFGTVAAAGFFKQIERTLAQAAAFDFTKDAGKTFFLFENEPGLKKESAVYSVILQRYLLALAYGYTVDAPDSPYYKNPEVLETYLKCLTYLYGRGIREGMTFHNNNHRMHMDGAPRPENGAGNIVKMELRMGGYCQYIWNYENGQQQNIYGQYFSHGSLTIYSKGTPVNDIASGYHLNEGWDWYRMPGTTAVHFPIKPQKTLAHRMFSPETFLGGVSCDGENGLFGMIINQKEFGDGSQINLKAHKSVFFVDDFILMLGSGISGGDGKHAVETTLFQSFLPADSNFQGLEHGLADPAGNRYYIPKGNSLKTLTSIQKSYLDNGKTPSSGRYVVAWFDHGLNPQSAGYEAGIGVRGATRKNYEVVRKDNLLHQVRFPDQNLTGYAFFQPFQINDSIIRKVNAPCLVMLTKSDKALHLGLANPDLGFLPRHAKPPTFRFINESKNQYLPSQPRPVEITLNGKWVLNRPVDKVTVVSRKKNSTVLRFDCMHGMDIRIKLVKE